MGQLLSICESCTKQFTYKDAKPPWHTCKAEHYIGEVTVKEDKECRDFKRRRLTNG